MKRLIFDLTKIPLPKCLFCMIAEVLHDQNIFTESNLGGWLSSYIQFNSGGHFSKCAAAAQRSGKVNHLKV